MNPTILLGKLSLLMAELYLDKKLDKVQIWGQSFTALVLLSSWELSPISSVCHNEDRLIKIIGVIEMSSFKFEIIETVAVLSEGAKGWKKELNLVSWNGREPKYDIRDWSEDHTKMGKGVTISSEELAILKKAINSLTDLV